MWPTYRAWDSGTHALGLLFAGFYYTAAIDTREEGRCIVPDYIFLQTYNSRNV